MTSLVDCFCGISACWDELVLFVRRAFSNSTSFIMRSRNFFPSNTFQSWPTYHAVDWAHNLRCRLSFSLLQWIRWWMNWVRLGEFLLQLLTRLQRQKFLQQSNILLSFLSCVFIFLSFDEFLDWNYICEPWSGRRRRYHLTVFPVKADRERRENRCDVFTSEDFRLGPVIGHKIIFTGEKNRPTSQIASSFQQMIFICQIML